MDGEVKTKYERDRAIQAVKGGLSVRGQSKSVDRVTDMIAATKCASGWLNFVTNRNATRESLAKSDGSRRRGQKNDLRVLWHFCTLAFRATSMVSAHSWRRTTNPLRHTRNAQCRIASKIADEPHVLLCLRVLLASQDFALRRVE